MRPTFSSSHLIHRPTSASTASRRCWTAQRRSRGFNRLGVVLGPSSFVLCPYLVLGRPWAPVLGDGLRMQAKDRRRRTKDQGRQGPRTTKDQVRTKAQGLRPKDRESRRIPFLE